MTYDWISFFDFDEFLVINSTYKIVQNFFGSQIFDNCDAIKINWVVFSDNEHIYYSNISIQERFTTGLYNFSHNQHIKSTVRGNLSTNFWTEVENPHTSSDDNFIACNSIGQKIKNSSPFNTPFQFENAFLKHFYTKSAEEFKKKITRGRASFPLDHSKQLKIERLNAFFDVNKMSKRKMFIFNYTLY